MEGIEHRMEGIEHRMVSVNGIQMHIAEKGQGPVVLFLYGFPLLWYTWRRELMQQNPRIPLAALEPHDLRTDSHDSPTPPITPSPSSAEPSSSWSRSNRSSSKASLSSKTSLSNIRESLPENPHAYDFSEICAATNNFLAIRFSSSSAAWRCSLHGKDAILFRRRNFDSQKSERVVVQLFLPSRRQRRRCCFPSSPADSQKSERVVVRLFLPSRRQRRRCCFPSSPADSEKIIPILGVPCDAVLVFVRYLYSSRSALRFS